MSKESVKVNASDEEDDVQLSPKEVLFEQMDYFRAKATALGNKIAKHLKEGGHAQELVQLYKVMLTLRKDTVDIAAKLAPFEHAKLSSVEIKAEIEHRFVIRAPIVARDTAEFLRMVNKDGVAPITTSDGVPTSGDNMFNQIPTLNNIPKFNINNRFPDNIKFSSSDDDEDERAQPV